MEFLAGDRAEQDFQSGGDSWPFQKASRPGFEWRRTRRFPCRLLPAFGNSRFAESIEISRAIVAQSSCPEHSSISIGNDNRVHSLALKLRDPSLGESVGDAFRERFGREGQFVLYDNAALRQRVFDIFDETFAVTSVLRSIAVVVAVAGVLFSLSALVIEREREIGVLRADGRVPSASAGVFLRRPRSSRSRRR